MGLTYEHLVTHFVPGPRSFSYFVPLLLLPIALLIPPSIASKQQLCIIFLPVITASILHAWQAMGGVDVISVDILLHSYFLLLFNDPRRDFRRLSTNQEIKRAVAEDRDVVSNGHVSDHGSKETYTEQAYPSNFRDRVPWVAECLVSIRFSDWRIGISSHDTQQPARPAQPSHLRFILEAITKTITGYLVLDLTSAWTRQDAYFWTFGQSIDSPLPVSLPFVAAPPRVIRCTILALQAWATVGQQFYLPCAIPVALHWAGLIPDKWSPHLWAPFFGSFSSISSSKHLGSVSLFWGRYWHQTLRRYCTGPGLWFADLVGLSRDSRLRYQILAFTTFFFSGIVHMGLVPPEPLFATFSANQIRLLIGVFFWLQPLGFAVEMVVSTVLRRLRLPGIAFVALNIFWFVAWCCFVIPLLGEAGRQLGYWRVWPIPLSPWQRYHHGTWATWI